MALLIGLSAVNQNGLGMLPTTVVRKAFPVILESRNSAQSS
jgi:hypothetical protein